ncbi:RPGF5 factor, partial [Polypterus senegalus]
MIMGSSQLRVLDLTLEGNALPVTLVQEEEDEDEEEDEYSSSGEATLPTFDVPYFRYIDEEGEEIEGEETEEEEWSSSRSLSSTEEDSADSSVSSDRYVVVSGTPEKILEHLLSDLHLGENQGLQGKETETLLDDFLLTYMVFMSTILSHVYITNHLYLSIKVNSSATSQEVLRAVAEKIEYPEEELTLVSETFPGEKHILQPHELVYSESMIESGRLFVCRKDPGEVMNPLLSNEETQQWASRILGMNTWDVALALTNFDWNLFNCIHEDPSLNHKAYRDAFKKMKPPKIPFMPLLLKGNDSTQKDQSEVKNYVHHLHIIDNQQMLFELSHRLEPRTSA